MGMWVFLAIIVIAGFWAIAIYNGLVTLRNRYKNAFSQIDVQLKRRYDLIPNLVESVKGYMQHERGTLDAVIKARGNAVSAAQTAAANPGNPGAMQGLSQAEGALGGALGRLIAVFEQYRVLAPGLQRLGDGVQHEARVRPGQFLRRLLRLRSGGAPAVDRISRRAQGAQGLVQLA